MDRKSWNRLIPAGAALAAVVMSLPAVAHEGHHEQMADAAALRHLLTEPDHLAILAAVVLLIAVPVARLALKRVRK
ncbi:HupE/UreJ family protein [Phenylobacterium sp. J367]|uniref:HupE/UreJ family protein n=1 Tax=Phenylobacterium sp. J367 TaxID=2898435 RepID=UPI002150A457|nr:HupE/UreJ family protein [Phenylobacterium sp. J367]MCR5879481.1 HupE/UreJ family protein [Phenylobacterium sp. J367]